MSAGSTLYCILDQSYFWFFFFQAEDGIRDGHVTGVQTCALPISGDGCDQVLLGHLRPVGAVVAAVPQHLDPVRDGLDVTEIEIGRASCREREWIAGVGVAETNMSERAASRMIGRTTV